MSAQVIVVGVDAGPASALFGARLDVIEASAANGELAGRECFLIACPDFHPEGAAIVWRVDAQPDWSSFLDIGAAAEWIKARRYNPESKPGEGATPPLPETVAVALPSAPADLAGGGPVNTGMGAAEQPLAVAGPGDNSAPKSIPSGQSSDGGATLSTAQVSPKPGGDTRAEEPAPLEPSETPENGPSSDSGGDWTQDIPPDPQTQQKRPKRGRKPILAAVDGNLARQPDPDAEPLPAALSEDALADHFVSCYGEDWRFVPEWGIWLHWKGDGWHRDTRNEVSAAIMRITREALEWKDAQGLTADGKRKINSKRTAWNARDVAATDPRISILAEVLDADPMLLGVPGGVVDLTNGKLLDASPEQYITRRCSVAPQQGEHPLFDRVLERACNGDAEMRPYLLRALGYACLTGKTSEEVFFCLVGAGGAGKGSLTKALQAIVGGYGDTIAIEALMETKHQRHPQEIAKLQGVRIVFANEPDDGCRFNAGLIKSLTSSEPLTAHRMRCDDVTFTPTHKIMLSMNALPGLKSVSDGAIKRRIHIIQYAEPLAEEERDITLKDRMVAEYPAILHTLIRGCVDWQECAGLGKPESVNASVDGYMEEQDSFAAFIDECLEREPLGRERSSDVYRRYHTWANAAGEYVVPQKRFVQMMRTKGFDTLKSMGQRMLTGLRLRAAPVQDERPHWQQD